ncbi:ankyrin repeat domain-containing protein [Aspergillus stella-maris]|uniref:ankyrin repeat domain-containing protein n=1 Tax=Aspergillus stella-maris TaxID=1810926 RepID=UPI003CCDB111
MVLTLLSHGTDVNFKDINGRSPLSLAAAEGHTDTVQTLVGYGANFPSIDMDGRRAIGLVASEGHHAIEDYLLARLVAKRPRSERTMKTEMHFMMFYAVGRLHEGRIRELLKRGVDVDSRLPVHSHTPLTEAIGRGASLSLRKLLLEAGANPSSSFSPKRHREPG